jgi:hypothetical protein
MPHSGITKLLSNIERLLVQPMNFSHLRNLSVLLNASVRSLYLHPRLKFTYCVGSFE